MLSRSYCNYWRFIKSLTLKAHSSLWLMIVLLGRRKDVHELALLSAVPFQCYIITQSQQSLRKHLHNLYSKFESRNQFHDDGSTLRANGFYVILKLNDRPLFFHDSYVFQTIYSSHTLLQSLPTAVERCN